MESNVETQLNTYLGGCHCGAIRFQVQVNPSQVEVEDCNCSICQKKGFLHLIVPAVQFTLLAGAESLTTYTFNTGIAKHLFCKYCGIHSFYRPRSHPEMYDVNLRCLDQNVMSEFRIVPFDGIHWEENIGRISPKDNR